MDGMGILNYDGEMDIKLEIIFEKREVSWIYLDD